MKCPLRYLETHYPNEQVGRDQLDCLKEECAWWNESVEKCCIPVLTANAIVLNLFIQEIADKLPKAPG